MLSRRFALCGGLLALLALPFFALTLRAVSTRQLGPAEVDWIPVAVPDNVAGGMFIASLSAWCALHLWSGVAVMRLAGAVRGARIGLPMALLWIAMLLVALVVGDYLVCLGLRPWQGTYYV